MMTPLTAAALAVVALTASANDYPTVDRVQFVEVCAREHADRSRQEMIYKCSCALDALADELSYEEFVDASTAFFAGQVAGKRGAGVRESADGRELTKRFRDAQNRAYKKCLIQ